MNVTVSSRNGKDGFPVEGQLNGLNLWMRNWIANGWRRGKGTASQPVKNADLWQELHTLTQRFDMSYEHVRGHAGHPENEECDEMAVAAIDKYR